MLTIFKIKTMINLIASLLPFILMASTLNGQATQGTLTYEVETEIGYNWEELIEEVSAESDTVSVDTGAISALSKFLSQKGFSEDADTSHIEQWTYSFNSDMASITGNPIFKGETFDLYYFDKLIRVIWRHHKGDRDDLRIDTMDYKKASADRVYQVQVNKAITRQINGYDCYNISVKEVRDLGRGTEMITNYELFVTEEIRFSPSVILDWGAHLSPHCPLYIKSWIGKQTKTYNEYRLISFEEGVDPKAFQVPERFRE